MKLPFKTEEIENMEFIFSLTGISFTSDGKFMAIAERRDIKDYVGIYYTKDWKLVNVKKIIEK